MELDLKGKNVFITGAAKGLEEILPMLRRRRGEYWFALSEF